MNIDFSQLDFRTAGFWPQPIKMGAYVLTGLLVILLGWVLYLSSVHSETQDLANKETQLRKEFATKQREANNLPVLQKELTNINQLLKTLITRLPNKNEIPALVINVSQSALSNGLNVELFQQKDETKHDFYAEKQIDVKFRGTYHQLGGFFSSIAEQPRLVAVVPDSLEVSLAPKTTLATKSGQRVEPTLIFTGVVRTYRYLSEAERAAVEAKHRKKKHKK